MKELINIANTKGFVKWFSNYSEKNHHLKGWRDRDEYLDEVEQPKEIMLMLLQKWLRETHQIYVNPETDQTTYPKFCYSISRFIGNPRNLAEKEWYWDKLPYTENWSLHREWEEALEEGLQEALKLI